MTALDTLFNRPAHNPSFHSLQALHSQELVDFCVPVNHDFPPPALVAMIREQLDDLLRYYPDYADTHQRALAEFTGLPAETLVPANGSTEVITLLCQQAEPPLATSIPTFGRWTDLPLQLGLPLHPIARRKQNGFRLTVAQIVQTVREMQSRTLVISNPNNPTGAVLELDEIRHLARELVHLDALIIDESFLDFSQVESAAALAATLPHVVVVKSLGKSLGWHGVRLGYAVAVPERAAQLRSRLPYWNLNGVAGFLLQKLPQFRVEFVASLRRNALHRASMERRLASLPELTVYPSQANFVFVELPAHVNGRHLHDRLLREDGLLIRETSNKLGGSEQFLRLAVHGPEPVDRLVSALRREISAA